MNCPYIRLRQPYFPTFIFLLILLICSYSDRLSAENLQILSGQVTSEVDDAPLPHCNITVFPGEIGTVTDSLGLYVLSLAPGEYSVHFSHLGYETITRKVRLRMGQGRTRLNIALPLLPVTAQTVTVLEDRDETPAILQKLAQQDIRQMPTLYSDVFRSIKILPGVTSNNELSSAYNVRGGNFDENLIYLNGYEIYRPFLLRQGVEENQSLINPDMVADVRFYGGAFPAEFGDKLSSALAVNYINRESDAIRTTARADLLHAGLAMQNHSGRLRWSFGARYANPGLFVNGLQTAGSYRPLFADVQLLGNYRLSSNSSLELFVMQAYNRFNLTPDVWSGNFKFNILDIRQIDIEYEGERNYIFQTGLAGLHYVRTFSPNTRWQFSGAVYRTSEDETADLRGDVFYIDNPIEPERGTRDFLKSRIERTDNDLTLNTLQLQTAFTHKTAAHAFRSGILFRRASLDNALNDFISEEGDDTILEAPQVEIAQQNLTFNTVSAYLQNVYTINQQWQLVAGLRGFYYDYNEEFLLSPRASLHYSPSVANQFTLSGGLYYQPPFFHELRNKDTALGDPLKSQRAIHAIASWVHKFEKPLTLHMEVFYKKLDRLIPYYLDRLKLVYLDENSNEGFAYGMDVLLKGQLVKTLNSWIGYSYLNTQERPAGGAYQRRLLDQRHTLRLFLQDRVPKHPFIQMHLRLLFGSGYRYFSRVQQEDPLSGETALVVDFENQRTFSPYARADMGLSARIKLPANREMVVVAEVLNVFNNINVAAYSWFQVFPGQPVRTPHIYTRRFFNLGVEIVLGE